MAGQVNVAFYEKVKELQETQHDSEQKRIELEQQLNGYMASDSRLAKLKAVRLQNYWRKICEDEKKSQWRNEQLLKDLERVENHLVALAAKTDRLRTLKQQYEDYIEQTYPHWKEQVMLQQRHRQAEDQMQRQLNLQRNQQVLHQQQYSLRQTEQIAAELAVQNQAHMTALMNAMQQPLAHSTGTFSQNSQMPPPGFSSQGLHRQPQHPVTASSSQAADGQSYGSQPAAGPYTRPAGMGGSNVEQGVPIQMAAGGIRQPAAVSSSQVLPSGGSTLQTMSSLPTSTWASTKHSTEDMSAATRAALQAPADMVVKSVVEEAVPSQHRMPPGEDQDKPLSTADLQPAAQATGTMSPALSQDDFSDIDLPSGSKDSPKAKLSPGKPAPSPRSSVKKKSPQHTPLSPRTSGAQSPTRAEEVHTTVQASSPRSESQSPRLPQPDVTVEGFCQLLQGVEQSFPGCSHPDEYYSILTPALSTKQNIVESANKGDNLTHYDPTALSMVTLNQLPLLNINSEGGCLIPDRVLINSAQATSEEIISVSKMRHNSEFHWPHIHPASITLWNALYDHFLQLLRYDIMTPDKIAEIFSPHLIDPDSPYEARARTLLGNVLKNAPLDDRPMSPESTITFNSMAVTPKPQIPMQHPKDHNIPPLNLGTGTGRTSSEFNETDNDVKDMLASQPEPVVAQPVAQSVHDSMPLTQTAAYRALLSGSMAATSTSHYADDEDTDDDIEQQLGLQGNKQPGGQASKGSLPTSPIQKQMPRSSKDGVTSPGSSASSRVTSPNPTSPKAYVPSALENSGGKSTFGSTSKGTKKPAFMYEESDEEIDIPMGTAKSGGSTAKHGEEKDDYDFYD